MVIWLIGLSGSGKTSVGNALTELLKTRNPATVMIDGDGVRRIMGEDMGHSIGDRETNGWRICRLCEYLDAQHIDVVCCILSLFPQHRAWNRKAYQRYFEVYIKVPLTVLEARDPKGLYQQARAGNINNVVGIDIPFIEPESPDLVINNAAYTQDFKSIAQRIISEMDEINLCTA